MERMDRNEFDDRLKRALHRDLVFRVSVWFSVSVVAGYFYMCVVGGTALSFFDRVAFTLVPLINTVGVGSVLLCVLALYLKDLEFISRYPSVRASTSGLLGGFVRRLAGDLSLWSLSSMTAIFSALLLALLMAPPSAEDITPVVRLSTLFGAFFVVLAVANILARRAGPTPWGRHANSSALVSVLYMLTLASLVGSLIRHS